MGFYQSGKIGATQERKLDITTTFRQMSQMITPLICSRGPFLFPKIHLLSLKGLPDHSFLLRWYLSLYSKPFGGVIHFSLYFSQKPEVYLLINLFVFLLFICLLLQRSQLRTQKGGGGELFFLPCNIFLSICCFRAEKHMLFSDSLATLT